MALIITNQVSLHDHQPQKINSKTYNFSALKMPKLAHHMAMMTIPSQYLLASSAHHATTTPSRCRLVACKIITLEMDLTKISSNLVQLVPALLQWTMLGSPLDWWLSSKPYTVRSSSLLQWTMLGSPLDWGLSSKPYAVRSSGAT